MTTQHAWAQLLINNESLVLSRPRKCSRMLSKLHHIYAVAIPRLVARASNLDDVGLCTTILFDAYLLHDSGGAMSQPVNLSHVTRERGRHKVSASMLGL